MILFADANGTIQANFGTPVYQGSANSNIIYLIAPYAPSSTVTVGFQLPDGVAVPPVDMTPLNAVPGVQTDSGTTYAGWSYVLPGSVTAKYGTVTAQFFFYAPPGESTSPTSIIATSATFFQVGNGAAVVLPDTPDADVYQSILSNIALLQTNLTGGAYGARAIFPWSNGATYGQNEITFYPSIGTYGAFVQSVVAGNTNNAPYVNGAINSAYWSEVVNFNTVTEDYFQQVQAAVTQAQSAAQTATTQATAAAESAEESASNATNAYNFSLNARISAEEAASQAVIAGNNASDASGAASAAQGFSQSASESAGNASNSAQAAANSATAAQGYAQQAQQYAQKHYQIVASVSALPRPGDSAYIYLVPTNSGTAQDSYSEYLWISESNDYEFIGTTADIDLSGYAQINGTYAGMTVGNATNAQTAQNAQQLGGVAASQYAKINGTYSGMTVGKATNADNATKATQDASGNVITVTYATKTENNAKYTKPSTGIPKTDLASAVQASLGKADSAYQKPSTGIPKGDLASAVQTSLNKADTALQSVPLATSSVVGGVKPVAKTDTMTQSVGVDSNGALFTEPGGGGSSGKLYLHNLVLDTSASSSLPYTSVKVDILSERSTAYTKQTMADDFAQNKFLSTVFHYTPPEQVGEGKVEGFFGFVSSTSGTGSGNSIALYDMYLSMSGIQSSIPFEITSDTIGTINVGGGSGADVPVPTTSDNGKILAVSNGAYALLNERRLYRHRCRWVFSSGNRTVTCYLILITDDESQYEWWTDVLNYYNCFVSGYVAIDGTTDTNGVVVDISTSDSVSIDINYISSNSLSKVTGSSETSFTDTVTPL